MKLGCDDHPPLRHLLARKQVDVDYLKVTSLADLELKISSALAYRPVLVHVGFGLGDSVATYNDLDWGWFNAQLRRAGSPHIAMHLAVSTRSWPYPTDLRFQHRDEARAMVAHLAALCRFLRDHLEAPLVLENVGYMGQELKPGYGVFRTSVEPAVMWQLVEEEGVGVLLDLAHLRITANHLGVDAKAFARSLPLHAVRELHVCGPRFAEGVGLRDDHREMTEADYDLLAWTLERTSAEIVTLEYPKARTVAGTFDEQVEALERQLGQLRKLTGAS